MFSKSLIERKSFKSGFKNRHRITGERVGQMCSICDTKTRVFAGNVPFLSFNSSVRALKARNSITVMFKYCHFIVNQTQQQHSLTAVFQAKPEPEYLCSGCYWSKDDGGGGNNWIWI